MLKVNFFTIVIPFLVMISLSRIQCNTIAQPSESNPPSINQGLIYFSHRENPNFFNRENHWGLYFVDLSTGEEIYLTEGSNISIINGFSWSPKNQQLLYTDEGEKGTDQNKFELVKSNLNGKKVQLTDNNVIDHKGRWSPDGEKIAFWSGRPDNGYLYLMDADGSNVQPIFDKDYMPLFGYSSVWSPDNSKLAVSVVYSYPEPINLNNLQDDLQIVRLNPKEILPPLVDSRIREEFTWSSDSNKLAYLSDRGDVNSFQKIYTTMYTFNLETQEETLIVEFPVIGSPHWSPVEDRIAFSAITAEAQDQMNVYLINGDGAGLEKLTEDGFFRVTSWSPDGNKLALEFIGNQLSEYEIFVLDIETKTLEQITDNDALDTAAVWVEF